jgi:gliding motility-associated-like protein
MKKIIYLWLLYLIPCSANCQENLFPNPGFEEFRRCYVEISKDSVSLTKNWSNPIDTPTLPSTLCDEGWAAYLKAIEARTGDAVQYLLIWYDDPRIPKLDFRRYLITELKQPLGANRVYFFRMYMRCIFNSKQGFAMSNSQGLAFSKTPPKQPDAQGPLDIEPAFQSEKIIDSTWTELVGCFTAKGDEKYAILGNFQSKNKTQIKKLSTDPIQIDPNNPGFFNTTTLSAYVVDDVELIDLFANIPQDTAICEGEMLDLNLKNKLKATYKWQDGSTSAQYRISKSGIYKVKIDYTINNHKCNIEQSIKVRVLPKSKTSEHLDTVVCSYKDVLLKVGTGRSDDTIRWSDSSTKDTLRVTKKGYYDAQITNSCGKYAQSFDVKFANCIIDIYVPTVFSPNDDNINDTFAPFVHAEFPIIEYEFGLYNRWGIEVFFSKEQGVAWDGYFKNQAAESGVFVWYLRVKGKVGDKIVRRLEGGDVTLIR